MLNKLTLFLAIFFISTQMFAQKQLPDLKLKDLEGKEVHLKDFVKEGEYTILSFWATWCKPCKSELDAIAGLYEDWQANYNANLIAVSIDDNRTSRRVIPLVEQKDWPYTILLDMNQDAQRVLNFRTIPQTFLIDKEGNIVYSHNGYTPGSEYELEDKMKAGK